MNSDVTEEMCFSYEFRYGRENVKKKKQNKNTLDFCSIDVLEISWVLWVD